MSAATGKYEYPLRVEHDSAVVSICTCHGDIRLMPREMALDELKEQYGDRLLVATLNITIHCEACLAARIKPDGQE